MQASEVSEARQCEARRCEAGRGREGERQVGGGRSFFFLSVGPSVQPDPVSGLGAGSGASLPRRFGHNYQVIIRDGTLYLAYLVDTWLAHAGSPGVG